MKLSKLSLFFLILNIVIPPLLGSGRMFGIEYGVISKLVLFLLPALYFISFLIDCFKNKKFKIDLFSVFLTIVAVSLILSIVFGITINFNTFTNLLTFLYLLGFIYSIHIYEFEKKDFQRIILAIISIFVLVSILGIIQYIFQLNLVERGILKYPGAIGRINSTMSIATILDKYLALNLLILMYMIYKTPSKRWILYPIILLGVFALAFTYSRTGIFCFYITACIFIIFYLCKKQFINSLILLLTIAILYLIPGQKYIVSSVASYANNTFNTIFEKMDVDFLKPITNTIANWFIIETTSSDSENNEDQDDLIDDNIDNNPTENEPTFQDDSISSRSIYILVAKSIMNEYPLTGIGIGNYNFLYKHQNVNDYLENDLDLQITYLYPHNLYVHYGAEVGYVGLFLLCLTFIFILCMCIKNKNVLLPLLFFGSFALFNFVESTLYMKDIAFWIVIVFVLMSKKNSFNN